MNRKRLGRAALVVALTAMPLVSTGAPAEAAPVGSIDAQMSPEDLYNRGVDRAQRGNYQGAIEDFTQLLQMSPNLAEAYISRGLARSEAGDQQGELADLSQVLTINPNYAIVYFNRGLVQARLGDNQAALEDLQRALELFTAQGDAANLQRAADAIAALQQQ